MRFFLQIGEEVYHVTGEVEMEGGVSFLHCSVNGVKSRPKLVILDNTVHLFSMVWIYIYTRSYSSQYHTEPNQTTRQLNKNYISPVTAETVFSICLWRHATVDRHLTSDIWGAFRSSQCSCRLTVISVSDIFTSFPQEGSSEVSVPVPKYLAGVSGSGAQGGAVAPMTGTIEKVSLVILEPSGFYLCHAKECFFFFRPNQLSL